MVRQTSAADNNMKSESLLGASSSDLEMLPHEVTEEILGETFAIIS